MMLTCCDNVSNIGMKVQGFDLTQLLGAGITNRPSDPIANIQLFDVGHIWATLTDDYAAAPRHCRWTERHRKSQRLKHQYQKSWRPLDLHSYDLRRNTDRQGSKSPLASCPPADLVKNPKPTTVPGCISSLVAWMKKRSFGSATNLHDLPTKWVFLSDVKIPEVRRPRPGLYTLTVVNLKHLLF